MSHPTSHWTPDDITDQTGRTALITGGNSGIGLETARVLAAHGARVVLAGRSQDKLDEAVRAVRGAVPHARTGTLLLDLSDLRSVREAAIRVAETETVDLLINNAGVMNLPERRLTRDGFETTVGTNHLGHFAFDAQVWPALRRAAAPRVVTVSAIAARWPLGRLDDLVSEKRYRGMAAYAKSKRANVVYTLELARRTAGTPLKALVIHPGAAMTNLQRHSVSGPAALFTPLAARLLMGSPEGAAWPSRCTPPPPTRCAPDSSSAPPAATRPPAPPSPYGLPRGADDPAEGARLWAQSERLTGVTFVP